MLIEAQRLHLQGAGGGSAGGEEYEKTDAFVKFSNRVEREPTQCARYTRGMPLLWPEANAPDPGTCAHCGAPRTLELQVCRTRGGGCGNSAACRCACAAVRGYPEPTPRPNPSPTPRR